MTAPAKRAKAAPKPPAGLKAPGRKLWRSILADVPDGYELDARELELLGRACRCADDASALDAIVDRDGVTAKGSTGQVVVHPAVAEARQLRLALSRLLSQIRTEAPADETESVGTRAARKAAQTRWDRRRQVAALRVVGGDA